MNVGEFARRGWNMIALPFVDPAGSTKIFRLMMSQYNETLQFTVADKGIPNRGRIPDSTNITDQTIIGLDYEQKIQQVAVESFPPHPQAGPDEKAIHHEPGLFLQMLNHIPGNMNVARLGSVPHGDSLLAMGIAVEGATNPVFPDMDGLPIGPRSVDVSTDVDPANPSYMDPYKHFVHHPFMGKEGPGFPGFRPDDPLNLLRLSMAGLNIKSTTTFHFDTEPPQGGILNIPFVVREANATTMRSSFFLHELMPNDDGYIDFVLQYAQLVMLDFGDRFDGQPGLIKWPHISINTLVRTAPNASDVEATLGPPDVDVTTKFA